MRVDYAGPSISANVCKLLAGGQLKELKRTVHVESSRQESLPHSRFNHPWESQVSKSMSEVLL